ncbi:MAG: ATP-binding cassette domain-containing protein [Elusimicrobiota bacterium]
MIEVKKLTKIYDSKKVLDNIDIKIENGEIFTIMGPSGTGKSTFIKSIIRLIEPDGGDIIIDGLNILKAKNEFEIQKIRKNFGYLFQEGALFDSLNVWENVSFGLKYLTNIKPEKYKDIAREKLELVGLKDIENKKVSELSGGMKKRVSLARAIAHNPKYILYDEPTTGLDPISGEIIMNLISEMSKKIGVTSIVVTHDVKLSLTISTRIGMLFKGRFIEVNSPQGIKNSRIEEVRKFIETSFIENVSK